MSCRRATGSVSTEPQRRCERVGRGGGLLMDMEEHNYYSEADYDINIFSHAFSDERLSN